MKKSRHQQKHVSIVEQKAECLDCGKIWIGATKVVRVSAAAHSYKRGHRVTGISIIKFDYNYDPYVPVSSRCLYEYYIRQGPKRCNHPKKDFFCTGYDSCTLYQKKPKNDK